VGKSNLWQCKPEEESEGEEVEEGSENRVKAKNGWTPKY
jgi:hypothetical protein